MEKKLFLSRCLSQAGDLVFNTLLDLWILNVFGSSEVLGTSLAVASIANFFASFLGGYFADSPNMGKYILLSEFLSFIISITNFFYLQIIGSSTPSISIINIFLFLINFNGFLLSPLMKKAISTYVEKDHIPKYNQWISITGQLLTVSVPAISTFYYSKKLLSISDALIINAISFLIAFIVLINLLHLKTYPVNKQNKYSQAVFLVFKNRKLQLIIILGGLLSLFAAELNVFFPFFVSKTLALQSLYGTVISFQAIGGICGALSLKLIKYSDSFKFEFLLILLLFFTLINIVALQNIYSVYLLSFTSNLVLVRYGVLSQTFIQLTIPKEFIGKIFSILFFILNLSMPIGSFLLGKILAHSLLFSFCFLAGTLSLTFTLLLFYKGEIYE